MSQIALAGTITNKKKIRVSPMPYFFLLPTMLVFITFVYFPFAKTIAYSFTLTNSAGNPVEFVGLENYITLFTSERFINSVILSFKFAAIVGIPSFIIGFVLSMLAVERSKYSLVYETMFALPMAIASAPAASIWFMLLTPNDYGMVNYILGTNIRWLLDAKYSIYAVGFVTIWLAIGVNFIFLLTGLKNVSGDILESARIDGAGYFRRLFSIMIPIASPQIFFVVFLNITSSFQAFSQIRILTEGGPSYSTNVLVYSIYQSALKDSRFERAFAQSVVLFTIILVITLVQFKFEEKVVFYQ